MVNVIAPTPLNVPAIKVLLALIVPVNVCAGAPGMLPGIVIATAPVVTLTEPLTWTAGLPKAAI